MATTRLSRLRTPKDFDQEITRTNSNMSQMNGAPRSPFKRIGLSEYTSQRLAELKARRAEADEELKSSKSKTTDTNQCQYSQIDDGSISSDGGSPSKQQVVERDCFHQSQENFSISAINEPPADCQTTASRDTPENDSTKEVAPSQFSIQSTSSPADQILNANDVTTSSNKIDRITIEIETQDNEIPQEQTTEDFQSCHHFQNDDHTIHNSYQKNSDNIDNDGGYVGFASLPDQVHRKAVKKGFDFTLMVVGEAGLGKSTLVSCLFQNSNLYKNRAVDNSQELITKTVSIEKKILEIEEKGVRLRLTLIDTPGFNDALDNTASWKTISDYIDEQYRQYFLGESGLNRRSINDSRVHCCLVFLSPLGRGIRQSEVALIKELQSRVNVIPVIAKADTLTSSEIKKLKEKILADAEKHDIEFYELPDCDSDEEDDFIIQDRELKAAIPFAIIGSNTVVEIGGKKIRGRMYPWGIVDVDDPKHCDFSKLRQFLIGTHTQDLKDVTQEVHYENYRAQHLQEQMNVSQKERKMKRRSVLPQTSDKIAGADDMIRQKEMEIERMKEMLRLMQNQLAGNSNIKPTML